MSDAVRSTTLDNGVLVLTERIPHVRSASLGVWFQQGASHEAPERLGESHMLEHLVFKGTERRTARELALSLESLGGSLDAYTTREHTAFQARVLDAHVGTAMEVLADLTLAPLLRSEDLELEREVVLEEIAQVEDTPDDQVFELHGASFWSGHAYGQTILGSKETVAGLSATGLAELHQRRYTGRGTIVAATGQVEHEQILALAERHFGACAPGEGPPSVHAPSGTRTGRERVESDTAQIHMVSAAPTVPHSDPRRLGVIVLSQALGGGMSSRLFQRIREELGLAYAVFSFHSFYARAGLAGVYLATRPESEEAALDALRAELHKLSQEGLTAEELESARQQVRGRVLLSLESTSARLYRLVGFALHDEPHEPLERLLARIEAVTEVDAASAAAEAFDPERQYLLTLGPAR